MNWDSKRRGYSCSPIELDWVLGFTVAVQPNLRAVKCQHALIIENWDILHFFGDCVVSLGINAVRFRPLQESMNWIEVSKPYYRSR